MTTDPFSQLHSTQGNLRPYFNSLGAEEGAACRGSHSRDGLEQSLCSSDVKKIAGAQSPDQARYLG